MSKYEQLEADIKAAKEKLEQATKELERLKTLGNEYAFIENKKYWVLWPAGNTELVIAHKHRQDLKESFKQGNLFETKEEAEKEARLRALKTKIKPYNSQFRKGHRNYYIMYNTSTAKMEYMAKFHCMHNNVFGYFKDTDTVKEVIAKFGNELKEFYV